MPANSILLFIQHAVVDQSQKKKKPLTQNQRGWRECYVTSNINKKRANFMTPGSKVKQGQNINSDALFKRFCNNTLTL